MTIQDQVLEVIGPSEEEGVTRQELVKALPHASSAIYKAVEELLARGILVLLPGKRLITFDMAPPTTPLEVVYDIERPVSTREVANLLGWPYERTHRNLETQAANEKIRRIREPVNKVRWERC